MGACRAQGTGLWAPSGDRGRAVGACRAQGTKGVGACRHRGAISAQTPGQGESGVGGTVSRLITDTISLKQELLTCGRGQLSAHQVLTVALLQLKAQEGKRLGKFWKLSWLGSMWGHMCLCVCKKPLRMPPTSAPSMAQATSYGRRKQAKVTLGRAVSGCRNYRSFLLVLFCILQISSGRHFIARAWVDPACSVPRVSTPGANSKPPGVWRVEHPTKVRGDGPL